MISISEALENRIQAALNGTLSEQLVLDRKEYNKKWCDAVQHFKIILNKERSKDKIEPLTFISVRMKLEGIKNIEDLRWFYGQCLRYKYKKKGNTFGKCFFGALKIK